MKTTKPASTGGRVAGVRSPMPAPPKRMGALACRLEESFGAIAAGDFTVREVEIPAPGSYTPKKVRATRERLAVSTAVFAQLMGVSTKLVEHWEQGRRIPAPLACRLLDRVNADPQRFLADLMRVRKVAG
jgi:DNA-binding transcriptional regulator YiaG